MRRYWQRFTPADRGEGVSEAPRRTAEQDAPTSGRDVDEQLWKLYRPYREVDGASDDRLRAHLHQLSRELPGRTSSRSVSPRAWLRWSLLSIALALLAGAVVLAAGNILNLGKPSNLQSVNPYFPLSGFHRIKLDLRQGSKPELLYIGTEVDTQSAAERWPLVKALEQFGSLSGVKSDMSSFPVGMPGVATFDLTHARYRSRYLTFVHIDLWGRNSHKVPFQPLTDEARALYYRYAREPHAMRAVGGALVHDPDHVLATLNNQNQPTTHRLPLIAIGDYLQTVSQLIPVGDFQQVQQQTPNPFGPGGSAPFSFQTIQQALVSGKDPPQTHVVEDVNSEANVDITLMCHADGMKPASVCRLPAIRAILKHVK